MTAYDEAQLGLRLGSLDRTQRTAFAAACAERLWPLVDRYSRVTGKGDVQALRSALDGAWHAANGVAVSDLARMQERVEGMVPVDDGEWVFEMGYGQNAIAAIAYAIRAWLTNDPQEAVWGARQVYEAADIAAQQASPGLPLNEPGTEDSLAEATVVQVALAGLAEDLTAVTSPALGRWENLRMRARCEGAAWARTLP